MIDHHDAEIRGRGRYHGVREADLEEELRGAMLTESGLARGPTGRYLRAAVPADAKAHARGFLEEAAAPKRPCGLSGVLCGNRHAPVCTGVWLSLRPPLPIIPDSE